MSASLGLKPDVWAGVTNDYTVNPTAAVTAERKSFRILGLLVAQPLLHFAHQLSRATIEPYAMVNSAGTTVVRPTLPVDRTRPGETAQRTSRRGRTTQGRRLPAELGAS